MKQINKPKYPALLAIIYLVASSVWTVNVHAADYPRTGDFSNGAKVWAQTCNRCHNMRGPKELRDDQWISTTFHMRIRAGLTGQEVRDVITFLQGSNTKSASGDPATVTTDSYTAETGKEIYTTTCIACHGSDGKGALPGAPDFAKPDGALSKSDNELITNISNGFQSENSPMAMPPKGGNPNLSTRDIKAVLTYIREAFGHTGEP